MPLIWCSISGHGFGHAAQVIPVLNELHQRCSDIRAILRTTVPATFFDRRLTLPWEYAPAQLDVGCVQHDALTIDIPATWSAHRALHADWEHKVEREATLIRAHQACLVLSDIPYVPFAAAAQAGIPAVGLSSLSWDSVLACIQTPGDADQHALIEHIRGSYARATLMIRAAPGLPMPAFRSIYDVGPIMAPLDPDPIGLRRAVHANDGEAMVAVGFGGLGVEALPWQALDAMQGYRFLVPGPVPSGLTRVVSANDLPFSFRSIMASADVIVTKPGYATIVEAVASSRPVVYVRRYNFADEEALVQYLHRYGRGVEMPAVEFRAGQWQHALRAVMTMPLPRDSPPVPTGAREAAEVILKHMA